MPQQGNEIGYMGIESLADAQEFVQQYFDLHGENRKYVIVIGPADTYLRDSNSGRTAICASTEGTVPVPWKSKTGMTFGPHKVNTNIIRPHLKENEV
jgi:hypothetical protein